MASENNTGDTLRDVSFPYQAFSSQAIWVALLLGAVPILLSFVQDKTYNDGLPIVNRYFSREPHFLSRLRWAVGARKILASAKEKFGDQPYRLARGDTDVVVLSPDYIAELNKLPVEVISSRQWHALTMLGDVTGISIVRRTSYHVKILLSRISPALPELLEPAAERACRALTRLLPQDPEAPWTVIDPLDTFVRCVSEVVSLVLYGAPTCDDPELVQLCHEHTKHLFTIVFVLRWIPAALQPYVVWLLPAKWYLENGWKVIEARIVPLIKQRMEEFENGLPANPDMVSWMVKDARSALQKDPWSLARLAGTLTAGGTYSTANFVVETLCDLVAHPELLEEVREEIRLQHEKCGGVWDQAAFNALDKLESAMKESSRLAPSAMLLYGRVVGEDFTLPGGLRLSKNQKIAVCANDKAMDPEIFEDPETYRGRRFYDADLASHRAQPFRHVDPVLLTWGSGRWACPGRFFANMTAKILLVKLLDEYEYKFPKGKRPPNAMMHEFILFHPLGRLSVRRRKENLGIRF
ncbi:hypothetical protein KVR01_000445 [Diaporthe batatas]|uniref:uncharacterized protein n=1 Tax=Diaporthe batatas TaxID=748121 RepID=UPI001D03A70F|nr:uncharacterized protein KVR01_000445 [Diaporthe batatas]KAG8169700.1 hypothetical protein KVR01_000445 [Diaporthe batatas]